MDNQSNNYDSKRKKLIKFRIEAILGILIIMVIILAIIIYLLDITTIKSVMNDVFIGIMSSILAVLLIEFIKYYKVE